MSTDVAARRAAESARREGGAVTAIALSLCIALGGWFTLWRGSVHIRDACMGSGNPAEYLAYVGVAVLCVLSHAPRLLRRS